MSYPWRFNKYLDALEDKAPFKKDNPVVVLNKGETKVLVLFRPGGIVEGFYNLLSGRASSNKTLNPLRLKVDNVDFSVSRGKAGFLYVCHPDDIPGYLRVKDFISFVRRLLGLSGEQEQAIHAAPGPDLMGGKTFGQLESAQKGEVLLAVLPYFKHGIYLVGNMGTDTGMSSSFVFKLSEIMKQWSGSGASVLYFTTEREVKVESSGNRKDRDFLEIEMWLEKVNHLKGLSEEE